MTIVGLAGLLDLLAISIFSLIVLMPPAPEPIASLSSKSPQSPPWPCIFSPAGSSTLTMGISKPSPLGPNDGVEEVAEADSDSLDVVEQDEVLRIGPNGGFWRCSRSRNRNAFLLVGAEGSLRQSQGSLL